MASYQDNLPSVKGGSGGGVPVNGFAILDVRDDVTGVPIDKYESQEGTVWLKTGVIIDDSAGDYPAATKAVEISGVGAGNSRGSISTYMEGLHVINDKQYLYVDNSSGSTAYVWSKAEGESPRSLFRVDAQDRDPSDVVLLDGDYYVIGVASDKLYKYNEYGVNVAEYPETIVDSTPYGVKYDKWLDCFWVLGNYNNKLFQLTKGGLYTGLSVDIPSATYQAIAVDEDYFYYSTSNGIIKVMDKATLTEVTTFNISANLKTILGMDVFEGKLYCNGRTTSATNYIFSYELNYTKTTNVGERNASFDNKTGIPVYKRIK